MANTALVGDAGQAAGARQHAEQGHFRQRHRRRTIVDQQDAITGQRHLVAATGAGAVHGGQELQARMAAGVLDAVARLVGELAEVDLPGVRRQTEHEDVGARAEDAVLAAGDDDSAHFRMLEADAVQRIVQFDVDTKIVGIELQLVAGLDAAILGDIHRQPRSRPVEAEFPVPVLGGIGLIVDLQVGSGGRRGRQAHQDILV